MKEKKPPKKGKDLTKKIRSLMQQIKHQAEVEEEKQRNLKSYLIIPEEP